jgi:hypothetical protein
MHSFKFADGILGRQTFAESILRPDPVFIVGMHRSGTSALAGALEALGLSIGKTLMPPDVEGNPKGHFENMAIAELHGRFLEDIGRDWMDACPIKRELFAGRRAQKFRKALPRLLSGEFGHERPLIKDPRLCVLLPLWMPLIQSTFPKTCFLLPVRHPVEVALSLSSRNGLTLSQGLALWTIHVLEAERATRGLARHFSTYSQLLESPVATMQSFAVGLDFSTGDLSAVVERRIDPALRHHSDPPWPPSEPHADLILAVYHALARRADEMEKILDDLREAYWRRMQW